MPTLIDDHGRVIADDAWQVAADDTAVAALADTPASDAWLLTLGQMQQHGDRLRQSGRRLGLVLDPADDPADAAAWLDRIEQIAVRFPEFTDGRGYSTARLLRQRHQWHGPLRAIGDVGRDQLFLLRRVGFDSFALRDSDDPASAGAAFSDFHERYQTAVDAPALFERRAETRPA